MAQSATPSASCTTIHSIDLTENSDFDEFTNLIRSKIYNELNSEDVQKYYGIHPDTHVTVMISTISHKDDCFLFSITVDFIGYMIDNNRHFEDIPIPAIISDIFAQI